MNKELKYNGYSAQPSDYESTDGDLSMSLGVVPENGSLHPVMPPKVLATWPNVNRVFIHKNNFTHYIVAQNGTESSVAFSWCDDNFGSLSDPFLTIFDETIVDITAIGNMLVVASSKLMYYVLWKNGAYTLLGNSIPDIDIAFALKGEVKSHVYTDKNIASSNDTVTTADEGWSTLTSVNYYFQAPSNGYSEYLYINENITLNANTNYAFSTQYFSDAASTEFCLEGISSSSNAYEKIIQARPRATSKHYTRTPNVTYNKLRLRVRNYRYSSSIISNTLIIEKGATSSESTTLKVSIKNTEDNYTALMSICNSFTNKYATQEGKFMFPFFVRYAIKLYDGSYSHISAPILMVPNSGYVPLLYYTPRPSATDNINVTAFAFLCDLQMRLFNSVGKEWEDIIQGVDIFVSAPVYTYNQGKAYDTSDNSLFTYKVFDSNAKVNELKGLDYGNLNLIINGQQSDEQYINRDLYDVLQLHYGFCDPSQDTQWRCVQIAPFSTDHIRNEITSTSNFYLIKSVSFNDLNTGGFIDVTLKDGALENLVNKRPLQDELLSNRTLQTANIYAYNNRLHAFNASFHLPEPKSPKLLNAWISNSGDSVQYVFVYLHTNQGTKVVRSELSNDLASFYGLYGLSWFYYPDNNAYKVEFVSDKKWAYLSLNLTRHEFLNGAYWLADSWHEHLGTVNVKSGDIQMPETDDVLVNPSTIYVSEVNNPFSFLSSMTVSVGCNRVLALATCAKPLSTAQFGEFPLYAFSDNGVWTLQISSTGSYVARKPITRDICKDVNSICQLESSVLFATDRGIMELSASSTNCITDTIKSEYPFNYIDKLPSFGQLIQLVNVNLLHDEKPLSKENITLLPFRTFIADCRIIYDYINQRIIIYNPSVRYAYVFSRTSQHWGMMQSDCVMGVNSYPEAQAIDEDGNLIDFGESEADKVSTLLVSRPFAMGLPDIHKTIDTVIQRGYFRKGAVGQVLYASNDMFHWYPVAHSADQYLRGFSGSPYKFYRLVVVGHLRQDECLYGCSIDFKQKLNNQLR